MDTDRRVTVTARATGHVVAGAALDMAGCLTGRMASPSVAGYVDGRRQYSRCRVAFDGNGGWGVRALPPVLVFDPPGSRPSLPPGASAFPVSPSFYLLAARAMRFPVLPT